MSIGVQTLIVAVILIASAISAIGIAHSLFRKNTQSMKRYGLCLVLAILAFNGAFWSFDYFYNRGLVGTNIDFGESIVEFGCCYDHHGDAIEVSIFEGALAEYAKIDPVELKTLPADALNVNEHQYIQRWVPVSSLDSSGLKVLELAQSAVEYAKVNHPGSMVKFTSILENANTHVSYIYNGKSRAYVWFINTETAQFIDITKY